MSKEDWKAKLKAVNYVEVRDRIIEMFEIGVEDAKRRRETMVIHKELDEVLTPFVQNPCFETAEKLLERYSFLLPHFNGTFELNSEEIALREIGATIFKNSVDFAEKLKIYYENESSRMDNNTYINVIFLHQALSINILNRTALNILGNDKGSEFAESFRNTEIFSTVNTLYRNLDDEARSKLRDNYFKYLYERDMEFMNYEIVSSDVNTPIKCPLLFKFSEDLMEVIGTTNPAYAMVCFEYAGKIMTSNMKEFQNILKRVKYDRSV
jgi:hypothetical protein